MYSPESFHESGNQSGPFAATDSSSWYCTNCSEFQLALQ